MDNFVAGYIQDMQKRNLSKNTLDAYSNDLTSFYNYISDKNIIFEQVDEITIMAYVQSLQKSGKATSSIVRSIVSIRNLYKYLTKTGVIKENPVIMYEIPRVKQVLPEILSIEEVDTLLNIPDAGCNKGIRDKAMLELMYATGVKVSELLNLSIYDVNMKLLYIKCKGLKGRERIVPFGSYASKCLEQYLKVREEFNCLNLDFLFFNSKGEKMTRQGFWKIVKHYAKEAEIDKVINLNTLRHSFAVHLLQNGLDIKSLQELLGHEGMSSTQIYSSISRKNRIADIYRKSHPRA